LAERVQLDRSMRLYTIAATSTLALLLTACPKDKAADTTPMTQAEARDALEESTVESQASALTTSSVEISTTFTIGKAVQEAAAEVRTFIGTQLPCADITLADATLTVKYGAKPGSCVDKGHTFTGTHSITVSKNDDAQVLVDHTWTDLSNGKVKVSGTAHVTWDLDDEYRKVEHDLTWTRISDGRTGRGTGNRTQKPLAGGLSEGIQVDGDRTWTGNAGRWDLAVQGVQMRWADPVPQAGTYRLASPKGRSLAVSFERVDGDTIEVSMTSGGRVFRFHVNSLGSVADKS
jgi:hypothetical protein